MLSISALWPSALGVLAILLVISGIDDLIPLVIRITGAFTRRNKPRKNGCLPAISAVDRNERRIALFVPCWRESGVIGNMVRHNLAAIRYRSFDFFLGVYPNDEPTLRIAQQLTSEFPNVHVAVVPHAGPTSKADCLNAVYACMEQFEGEQQIAFDTVVLHDAEDLIHPEALSVINRERLSYEMVQVPVLPLKTGLADVTHGVYCDEFAEFQTIDMPAREISRSFIPSNGVGTGFSRQILDRLSRENNRLVFDPASLTEDYEIGVRIHAMGFRQTFAPLTQSDLGFVATREYFPRSMSAAIRQRTRWLTGIVLQCWERHGWQGSWRTRYWFWRDRKGLIANPLSVAANVLYILGILDTGLNSVTGWHRLLEIHDRRVAMLCMATLALQCVRTVLRAACVYRIFGLSMALAVPLRCFHANLINSAAAVRAVSQYFKARRGKRALTWLKTDHAYPDREALNLQKRNLADVLIGQGYVSEDQVAAAKQELEDDSRLDLLLLARGLLSQDQLCRALSLQSGLASAKVDLQSVNKRILRNLPARLEQRYGVLPFDVAFGRLLVASTLAPDAAICKKISEQSGLPVEFQLVTAHTYSQLKSRLSALPE